MKKIVSIVCLLIFALSFSFAQENEEETIRDKIKARRVAFITDKLALSSKEAQVFWPIYNEYRAAEKTIRKKNKRFGKLSEMTDQEIEQAIDERLSKEMQLVQLKSDFVTNIKSVLPIKKVAKLFRAERKYKEWMLQQVKKG